MRYPGFKTTSFYMLAILAISVIGGCSRSADVRIDASGTVTLNGQPVPSGTLVLTPKVSGQMPVASRIENGHFEFDTETGPRPGEYIARVKPDEATIEEIATAAEEDPRGAAKKFHANHASSPSVGGTMQRETLLVIGDIPGQTLTIEL